jgi:hypothetical protein
MNYKALIAAALAATTVAIVQASIVDEAVPKPWFKNGQAPASNVCKAGVDTGVEHAGTPNLTLKCDTNENGFVGVMQMFSAKDYLGKRVRFSALVKAEGIEGWGGLWMRVDQGAQVLAFDNMQNRPIKGSLDWTSESVVLDVPKATPAASDGTPGAAPTGVFFGILMNGKGQLWISNVQVDVVGSDVPTTSSLPQNTIPSGPGNLSLSR